MLEAVAYISHVYLHWFDEYEGLVEISAILEDNTFLFGGVRMCSISNKILECSVPVSMLHLRPNPTAQSFVLTIVQCQIFPLFSTACCTKKITRD